MTDLTARRIVEAVSKSLDPYPGQRAYGDIVHRTVALAVVKEMEAIANADESIPGTLWLLRLRRSLEEFQP